MFSLTLIYTSPVSNKNKNKNYIMLTLIFASNLILEYRSIKKFDTMVQVSSKGLIENFIC